jgi:hypothetical protein
MLALTDSALAYLAIAATAVHPGRRRRWLREIAAQLDPPNLGAKEELRQAQTPAARRQAKVRARRKNGIHIYRLELSDRAVEGIVDMLVAAEKLTEAETLDHRCIETMLARLLEEQGARWAR